MSGGNEDLRPELQEEKNGSSGFAVLFESSKVSMLTYLTTGRLDNPCIP
jgi:hypothetical protein